MIALQAAISGALLGGLFAMMAVGMSLTWGMLRVINLAHFGMILVSAYLTYGLATTFRIDPILTIVATIPIMFVLGAALQWAFERFEIVELNSLLVSFGLLIIVVQLVSDAWSADFLRLDPSVNPYATQSLAVGDFIFPMPTLLAFVFAVVFVGGAQFVLGRTFAGRAVRAFAQDRTIASAFGIDHARLGMMLSGVAGASAAIAGMLFALGNALTPSTPYEWFGVVFALVILGGIGDVLGTLVAGILIGTTSAVVSVAWSPAAAPLVLFSAIIVALLFRPRGLFARGDG